MGRFERYKKAIAYIEGLTNLPLSDDYMSGRTKPGIFLKRTRYFLDLLDNPERGFKFIHISGTAGKGTVTTMVHEALLAAGKRVGSFTSPFATVEIEKIRVGGEYIAPEIFADIVDELKEHIERAYDDGPYGRPSYFEIYFAIALLYFKRMKCEWVVLEVGAGGRYDATNIIESPVATAITSIDYDHVQILGKTLLSIADNKAGIIKKGSAFFTTEKRPALLTLFERECNTKGASYTAITPVSEYQENNRKLARALCAHVGIPERIADAAIADTKLPCRFELVRSEPRVVLDGAHNRAKMRSTVENLKKLSFKKLHLVLGVGEKKDTMAILREIVPVAEDVYFTRFQNTSVQCADPKTLRGQSGTFLAKNSRTSIYLSPESALDAAIKNAGREDLVLVTGSFYLSGELRERWYPEEWVLEHRKSF